MLRFGLPSGLNWFFEFAAFNVFINFVVVQLGTTGLAAMNAVIQVNSVSFMPAFGVASAGAVLTGQALGRGRPDHAEASVGLTLRVNAAWQATVGVIYLLIPAVLLAPFTDPDQPSARFMELGVRMLMLSSAWQLFDAAANSYAEGLRAAGDTTFPLVVRLIIAWVFWVPASLIVVNVLGGDEVAAVLSLVGYFGLLALALAWRWRSGKWRTIALVEGPPPEGVPL